MVWCRALPTREPEVEWRESEGWKERGFAVSFGDKDKSFLWGGGLLTMVTKYLILRNRHRYFDWSNMKVCVKFDFYLDHCFGHSFSIICKNYYISECEIYFTWICPQVLRRINSFITNDEFFKILPCNIYLLICTNRSLLICWHWHSA